MKDVQGEKENIIKEMEEFNLEKAGLAGSKAGKALREELIELIELGNGKLDVSKASQTLQKVMKQLEKERE